MAFAIGWEILWLLILGFCAGCCPTTNRVPSPLPLHSAPSLRLVPTLLSLWPSRFFAMARTSPQLWRSSWHPPTCYRTQHHPDCAQGWQFVLAQFAGAPIMVAVLVLLFRLFLPSRLLHEAMQQGKSRRCRPDGRPRSLGEIATPSAAIISGSASSPVTNAPRRTNSNASAPPPQPTSSSRLRATGAELEEELLLQRIGNFAKPAGSPPSVGRSAPPLSCAPPMRRSDWLIAAQLWRNFAA